MAKNTKADELVECKSCVSSGPVSCNNLMDCTNKERNPKGYKVGDWPRKCKYFKPKQ